MKVSMILQLSLLALGGALVYGDECHMDEVTTCYDALVHYESLAFPLYGADEAELNDTCNNINASFACINEFLEENYDRCRESSKHIYSFFKLSGLKKYYQELCIPNKPLREVYLENYHCLETNADEYAICHNISQISQEYMATVHSDNVILDRCCFFYWYQDCFTNITENTCGVNATVFVSLSLHLLLGDMATKLCESTNITCHVPPMPDEYGFSSESPSTTDLPKDSSPVFSCAIMCLIAAQCIIVLSKYLL